MKNESISLLSNLKERAVFLLAIFAVLSFNLMYHYIDYQNFKKEEIIRTRAQVVNIYSKERFDVLKLQTRTYFFFTSVPNDLKTVSYTHLFNDGDYIYADTDGIILTKEKIV